MNLLIQRVKKSSVSIAGKEIASIDRGILVMVGLKDYDNDQTILRSTKKIISYCFFSDTHGRINKSVKDVKGAILLIPQITLSIDTNKGIKPNFSDAGSSFYAEKNFEKLKKSILEEYGTLSYGKFGADMQVDLSNDGPVSFFFEIA